MPNYRVGDTPVQLAQSGARAFLVRNIGTVPVYLEEGSTVSSTAYGLELQPLDSANWPQDKALWIVSALGAVGDISVLYGAEGVSLGAVSAVVTGDVTATIDGPVDATITGPVTVEGTVSVGNVVSTEVTNTVDTTITGTVDTVVTGPVTIGGTVAIDGDVGITGPVTVTGVVDANITNASIDVVGTVDANITNATIDATVTGNIIVDSGEVNVGGILTPVQVQGGGEVLLNQTGTVNAGTSTTINIPGPASGLTYFGIGLIVTNTSKTIVNDSALDCYLYNVDSGAGEPPIRFQAGIISGDLGEFGSTATARVAAPVGTTFPIRLDLDNTAASGNMGYRVIAIGLSYADVYPRDFGQWENGSEARVVLTNTAAGVFATIAPSFEPREFLLTGENVTAGGNFFQEILNASGSWVIAQSRLQNSYYGNVNAAADFATWGNAVVRVSGDGRIHRIRCGNALTGTVGISYLGRAT